MSLWVRAVIVVIAVVLLIGVIQYGTYQLKMQMARFRGENVEVEKPALAVPWNLFKLVAVMGFVSAFPLIAWRIYCERARLLGVIRPADFARHVLVFGSTGSGKTSTALRALKLSLRKRVSAVILDWKGEYAGKVVGATVVRKFNLLEPPDWSQVQLHIMVVTDILRDVLGLTEPMAYALYEELSNMYEEEAASFSRLLELVKIRRAMMLGAKNYAEARIAEGLIRRLLPLALDESRKAVNVKGSDQVVIYDLSVLPTHQLRVLYAEIVLWRLYNEARSRGTRNGLRRLIIAEEGQNYVRPRRIDQPPSIGERIVNELRAYGYGCLIISPDPYQLPLHVSRDCGAIVSIGYQALPEPVIDILSFYRYADVRKLIKTASKPRTYIYHDGRLYVKRTPRPFKETIDLGARTVEEVVEAEERSEKAELRLEEGPEPMGGKPPPAERTGGSL